MVDAEGTSFIWPKSNQPIRTGSNDGCQFFGPLISGTVSAIPVDAAKSTIPEVQWLDHPWSFSS